MSPRPRPVMQRILERTEIVDRGHDTPCWIWTGSLNEHGYGKVNPGGAPQPVRVHRIAYSHVVGPIADGLELDHLCCQPACWNPDHLEPVTHAENMRRYGLRVSHCPRGHVYDEANTYRHPRTGGRVCRTCRNAGCMAFYYRRRAS